MRRRTWAIEIGKCGFGLSGDLVPELRLGWVRVWTCSGSVVEQLSKLRMALADAAAELRMLRPEPTDDTVGGRSHVVPSEPDEVRDTLLFEAYRVPTPERRK